MFSNIYIFITNVAIQQLCSLFYDISVIVTLKRNIFNNKECLKLIDSDVIYYRNSSISLDDSERIKAVGNFIDDSRIDPIRVLILNFNYIFMYIDQVLLVIYVNNRI
ncbi:hypothetical protein PIROE2DRAFT_1764 [Piromyces sp. E2]|nr:hypothetical protein PIROE2DRAFT_1764 [Piromyces sp. E2]|eukprot:OUM70087.1 hypothetical protein PIROE2DRAFT_1764 [Piromyces sp. E2]